MYRKGIYRALKKRRSLTVHYTRCRKKILSAPSKRGLSANLYVKEDKA
jgi:hypothetical protein